MVNRILRWRFGTIAEKYASMSNDAEARVYAAKALFKHVTVMADSCREFCSRTSHGTPPLPEYMRTVGNTFLCTIVTRLYAAPVLRVHIPSVYQFLRPYAVRIMNQLRST